MVFILDEFDLFAKPFKQTVLYNLLDALQTSSVQVRPPLQANKPKANGAMSGETQANISLAATGLWAGEPAFHIRYGFPEGDSLCIS